MLKLDGLHVGYGAIRVLRGVSMQVADGAITALIGANGAGKSTMLKAISGLLTPTAGSIMMQERRIDGLPPEQVVRLGVVQVPEGRKVFRNLTVHETLIMGGYIHADKAAVAADIDRMYEAFPRLAERRQQLSGTLSGGEQQMLAFARALVARPRLLLLDEPSMGLAPRIVADLGDLIRGIRKQGVTVLLVEQNAALALSIADEGHVLEGGAITLSSPASELLANDRVREAYLGV